VTEAARNPFKARRPYLYIKV